MKQQRSLFLLKRPIILIWKMRKFIMKSSERPWPKGCGFSLLVLGIRLHFQGQITAKSYKIIQNHSTSCETNYKFIYLFQKKQKNFELFLC